VPGADHFFNGLEDVLVQRVRAWLQRAIVVQAVTLPANEKR
jgi:hypothetical protein